VNARVSRTLSLVVLAASLSACSSAASLLGGSSSSPAPQAVNIPVGNQLALPPDLALAAPRQTVDAYQSNGPVASNPVASDVASAAPATTSELYSANQVAGKRRGGTLDETLAFYNISKLKPDGTPKTVPEINHELTVAIKAEKRRTNPNYGTIFNIGEIFSDG
jgi:hypothetical protein